jgi:hypothetical protein
MQTVIAHGRRSIRGIAVECLQHVRLWPVGRGHVRALPHLCGPRTAPGGLFVRESRYAEARTSTSAVAAAVCVGVSSPPLCRTCHDVRSSASWSTKSVSRRQQSVSTYTRHAVPLCTRAKMVGTEGLGSQARQAKRPPQGQGRRRAQARGHSAAHVGRWNRVQLVDEQDSRVARIRRSQGVPRHGGKSRPCRERW